MPIFKFITLSQLRKVLSAIHQRFLGVENDIEEINEINVNVFSKLDSIENNIPLPYNSLPNADFNNGAKGSSDLYARGDHVHPSDSSKANVSDVLTKTNTTQYLPTNNYHPATKLYVDTKCNEPVVGTGTVTISGTTASFASLTPSQVTTYWSRKNPVYYYESLGQEQNNKRRYELISVVNDGAFYDFVFYGTDGSSDIYITTHIYSSNSDATGFNGTVHSYPAGVVQSDWNENDSSDGAYILNKPAIKAGTGDHSVAVGDMSDHENAATYYLTISGAANATEYTYSSSSTISAVFRLYGILFYNNKGYAIDAIDTTNNTITLYNTLSTSAISNEIVTLFAYQKFATNKNGYIEGNLTISTGTNAHAEGGATKALGNNSHAEGSITVATMEGAHAEGTLTRAVGNYSHAEGQNATAKGVGSHAEGTGCKALGLASHAEGFYTIASSGKQHAQGKFNIEDANDTYAHIVGNGTSNSDRSNIHTLDWSGNGWYAGKLTVGAAPTNDMDAATKKYVDDNVGSTDLSNYLAKDNAISYTPTADYHPATKKYVDDATAGITNDLSGLTDTIISSPTNGQALMYNSTTSKWENIDIPSDWFVVNVTNYTSSSNNVTVDKTVSEVLEAYNAGKHCIAIYSSIILSLDYVYIESSSFQTVQFNACTCDIYYELTISSAVSYLEIYSLIYRNDAVYKTSIAKTNHTSNVRSFPTTAVQAYATNDLFFVKHNVLAKATTDIASGATLTKNTNYVETTIENEIKNIGSSFLSKTNTTSYTPTADYHPATKKYVDDSIPVVPTKVSDLTNDSGFITSYTETDPIFVASVAHEITSSDISNWNSKTSLTLGTTSSTAFRGDYGDSAYTHAVTNKGSAFSSGLYKITTNSEGHVTAVTSVEKSDITGLGIPAQDTTYTFDGTYNSSTNKVATVSTVTNAVSGKANNSDVLTKTNTTSYTPSSDYHPATKKYVDDVTAGITSNLSGLTDTTITTPTDGQLLRYNATTSKWENVTLSLAISGNTIQLKEGNTVISSITLPVYNGGVSS